MSLIYSHTTVGINNSRTLDKDVIHKLITIPAGFEWDGASVPRPLWFVMPKWGENSVAFLMHDWLYSCNCPPILSRKESDKMLYDDLLEMGVFKPRAWCVYSTVRVFGARFFKKK